MTYTKFDPGVSTCVICSVFCFFYPLQSQNEAMTDICQVADKQLFALVGWAKRIPHFTELPLEDQVILLRAGRH
jgi:hypothetical protein